MLHSSTSNHRCLYTPFTIITKLSRSRFSPIFHLRSGLSFPDLTMSAPLSKFTGWVANSPEAAEGKMVWTEFSPKRWEESDIDIKISHCGICGSDVHTMSSGWETFRGATSFPCVVGHEIVGEVVRVGNKVEGIKLGDRVGVGANSGSCFNETEKECTSCARGQGQFCLVARTGTYNAKYLNGDKSYGGYATHSRVPARWAFKIPDNIPSEDAAPMLCAGITTYRPLTRNGCGPGKKVGVIGIGGLGHFGLLWAKALGADEVVAITRTRSKEADAKALGADRVIATAEEGWVQNNLQSLDLIISTVSNADMPFNDYLSLLAANGHLVVLGLPEDKLPALSAFSFVKLGISVGGSLIGSIDETKEMLAFASAKGIKPWVNVRPMSEANQAVVDFNADLARYRIVLKQD